MRGADARGVRKGMEGGGRLNEGSMHAADALGLRNVMAGCHVRSASGSRRDYATCLATLLLELRERSDRSVFISQI